MSKDEVIEREEMVTDPGREEAPALDVDNSTPRLVVGEQDQAMKSANSERSTSKDKALQWAAQYIEINKVTRVSDKPWARTYKLKHRKGCAYLKILPAVMHSNLGPISQISAEFPQEFPTIIASDNALGLVLTADHGGIDLPRSACETDRSGMLSSYASLQAKCVEKSSACKALPAIDLSTLVDDLLRFLARDGDLPKIPGAAVQANYFLSSTDCKRYLTLLKNRKPLLQKVIASANSLPFTLNHCDLRPSNAAKLSDGKVVLYDWDEAMLGPAGFSLHALYSGCVPVLAVMQGDTVFQDVLKLQQAQRELGIYLDTLISQGYSTEPTLSENLGAAALAGMIHYLIGFSRFPRDSRSYRRTIRKNLARRLSSLLDACDYLSIVSNTQVLAFAEDYAADGRHSRAEALLNEHLRRNPENDAAYLLLGKVLCKRGRLSRSVRAFRNTLEINPDSLEAHAQLGDIHTQLGDYGLAKRHYRRASGSDDKGRIAQRLTRLSELENAINDADRPGVVPAINFSQSELDSGKIAKETLAAAEKLFRKHGILHIKNVFDPDLLSQCETAFHENYKNYMVNARHKDALRIGDKRFQITVNMQAPYNSSALYGNPLVLPLMKRLLGKYCILGCFTSAMSLPGSLDQRLHKDHKDLFYDDPDALAIPSFAVTMMVPLIDLNENVGTTKLKKGTHRLSSEQSKDMPYQTPLVKRGDCYLMDYRASHHGQANQSDSPRPILSLVYQRPWFRDYINFKNQPSLRISQNEFDQVPGDLKPLLAWTTEPGPLSS